MKTMFQSVTALVLGFGAICAGGAEPTSARQTVTLRIVEYVAPEYPGSARLEGVAEGTAVVIFSHDSAGRVNDALAVECTHPAFGREAVEAVRQWQVAPHGKGGDACQNAHLIRFSFQAGGVVLRYATSGAAARSKSSGEIVVTFDDLETKPRLISSSVPALPAGLRSALKLGLVRVTFVVDEKGWIRVPSLVSTPDPAMGAAVLAALAKWRYEAPQKNGQAVVAMTDLTLDFGNPKALAAVVSPQEAAGSDRR